MLAGGTMGGLGANPIAVAARGGEVRMSSPHDHGLSGYSGTPQARKLGLKEGLRVDLHRVPDGWALHEPPDGLRATPPPEPADVILAFFEVPADLDANLPALGRRVFPDGAIWVLWPRRAAGHRSDMTEMTVARLRSALGPAGAVVQTVVKRGYRLAAPVSQPA